MISCQRNTSETHLESTALSVPVAKPPSSRFCPADEPDMNPFFLTEGSVLDKILEIEKFVEPPLVFCCVEVALASFSSLSLVFITGKHVVIELGWLTIRKPSGSGELFLLVDSGLDTTFTSMSLLCEEVILKVATRCKTTTQSQHTIWRVENVKYFQQTFV